MWFGYIECFPLFFPDNQWKCTAYSVNYQGKKGIHLLDSLVVAAVLPKTLAKTRPHVHVTRKLQIQRISSHYSDISLLPLP